MTLAGKSYKSSPFKTPSYKNGHKCRIVQPSVVAAIWSFNPRYRSTARFNSVAKFSPTKLNQTEFLTNKGINSCLFTEGALDFSPTKRNLLLILEISHQPVGEKCHTIYPGSTEII